MIYQVGSAWTEDILDPVLSARDTDELKIVFDHNNADDGQEEAEKEIIEGKHKSSITYL